MTTLTRKQLELAIAGGTATTLDFDGHSLEAVREIKEALPVQTRQVSQTALKMVDEASKTIDLIYNVQVVDRMGDLVIANPSDAEKHGGQGWLLEPFHHAGGPYIMLHEALWTVARCIETRIQQIDLPAFQGGGKAWALIGRTRFYDVDFMPYSQAAWLLTKDGITGSSVGFRPHKVVWIDDEEERVALGIPPYGAVLPTNELLECSKAPIPANQVSVGLATSAKPGEQEGAVEAALARYVDQGQLSKALRDDYVRSVPLGPMDHAQRVAARVRAFVDLHLDDGGASVPLECVDGECRVGRSDVAWMTGDGGGEAAHPKGALTPCCDPCEERGATMADVRAALGVDDDADVVAAAKATREAADGQAAAVLQLALGRVERAQDAAGAALELVDDLAEDIRSAVGALGDGEEDPELALESATAGRSDGSVRSGTGRRDQLSSEAAASTESDEERQPPADSTPVSEGEQRRQAQQPEGSATGGDEVGRQQTSELIEKLFAQHTPS